MRARFLRLLFIGLVLSVSFIIPAMNSKGKFGFGFLTWTGCAVLFHLLVFEAVFTKSKPLTVIIWIVVVIFSGLSFFLLDNLIVFLAVVVFLAGYTALLMLYLEKN